MSVPAAPRVVEVVVSRGCMIVWDGEPHREGERLSVPEPVAEMWARHGTVERAAGR